ncbi:MAG: autoinducer binding domain-containing protein [Allosphingosinicella sp.]|uniref:helix-turn-helix transcriptional regulator n=1 Tax=Allosphingosinicella sp. TaxID=2823234 RepID=UPI003953C228
MERRGGAKPGICLASERAWKRSRLIEAFDARASRCGSGKELGALLSDVSHELGFRYFALLHHASLAGGPSKLIRIDNYPDDWEDELVEGRLFERDPVHEASVRTNVGFPWRDLGKLVRLTDEHRRILSRGRRYGIGDGFTVPANVPGEPSGSCTFSGPAGMKVSKAALRCAELIGAHAFFAARQMHGYQLWDSRPHLSRRERECLSLLAAGKTDWEIAAILGLSPETVHQYVKRARAAYDVVSRTQLVVRGLRDGWIRYPDV